MKRKQRLSKKFTKEIPSIIKNGEVEKDNKGRIRIETDKEVIGLKNNWLGEKTKNKWIITGYFKKENAESLYASSAITKGEALPLNSKEDSSTNAINLQTNNIKSKTKAQIKKEELLQKYKEQLAEIYKKMNASDFAPNQSNAIRARQRNLSTKAKNLEAKINDLQRITLDKQPLSNSKDDSTIKETINTIKEYH